MDNCEERQEDHFRLPFQAAHPAEQPWVVTTTPIRSLALISAAVPIKFVACASVLLTSVPPIGTPSILIVSAANMLKFIARPFDLHLHFAFRLPVRSRPPYITLP
ncbi:hypothetical protein PR003_g22123 [Phytophthora rubi]|uniref:Uncharacterized protein n=1 Tax=Phytophthora rubi TaxID=129364 RepID=A0A6A4D6U2_9STRA|nr:hypothetical protein PR002_g21451 [Phytophthora rubi]KAE8992278.1 hypothetical protein PR001_g20988 [Phytophthora rubi]KAE9302986.1 hypothetical protein PR003_g22123 [Phytophthora rubi]